MTKNANYSAQLKLRTTKEKIFHLTGLKTRPSKAMQDEKILTFTGSGNITFLKLKKGNEKFMNVLYLMIGSLCVFALAYRYYAAFIATKVLMLDDRNIAPSVSCNDGQNYVPTNKWVVFGHHFAAIAGAGPLIGPVLAAQYGWGPGFFWILLGSVFGGCVHDMIVLFASYRHKGQSLSVIAEKDVSKITGGVTAVVILFIIIVTLAGLAVAVVNSLFQNPWGFFSIVMTIPIAMIIGIYMFK
ncbi:MAG: carbon starvation CstA family protein, partial [Smithella sp.]